MEYIPAKTDTGEELKKPKHERKKKICTFTDYLQQKKIYIS